MKARLLFAVLVAACGTTNPDPDPGPDPEPDPEPMPDPDPADPDDPLDESVPDNALAIAGVSPTGLNPRSVELRLVANGIELAPAVTDFVVSINDIPLDPSAFTIAANQLRVQAQLDDGRNDIAFAVYDTLGRPLYARTTAFAGSSALEVRVVDEANAPFTAPVDVVLALADDPSITEPRTTTSSVTYANVPGRTVLVTARTADNRVGVTSGVGSDGVLVVQMLGFDPASPVANNDLALGLDGWNTGTTATIVNHVEAAGPAARVVTRANATDNDVQLVTSGQGPQSLSRTFATQPGTTSVVVRYRFITSEVPGGFFGSEFNDSFSVNLRSALTGAHGGETATMNGLGLAAFDASGGTDWHTVTLAADPAGDVIQLDARVENVADGQFDSLLVVDFIAEKTDRVQPQLAWNATAGGLTLTYTIDGTLDSDVTIDVYWASGQSFAARIGAPFFTHVVPAGSSGNGGPIAITGAVLSDDPEGTTTVLAASSETKIGVVADVDIAFGPKANPGTVTLEMIDIVKDSMRAAGQAKATITSTARSAADQARAMFQNLTKTADIAANIQAQREIYLAPGQRVIDVFEEEALLLDEDRDDILAQSAAIQAKMLARIELEGAHEVSRHCADPATITVIDIARSAFVANRALFKAAANPRLSSTMLDEEKNDALHLERTR